ncbi:nitrate reductase catalytic subunit NapA [Sutterella sp.]|uniref:nitrate reductase catalytic subunit NapA n=1 Tax=Sutterella sp. TaxID=1981025 RepID=UPI0026DEE781|nr:nitrate reductase catalytic subunit NapA [Sutterella sp.]MDO5530493.1 nitrate reductase catalytic subunit NapA [Sutterella sp.]
MTQERAITFHRRTVLKSGIAASAAMALGIPVTSAQAADSAAIDDGITWHKGVCRFCGTGCGLQVGVRDGRVVATKGDPDAPVNRGLNCVKGYFNAKIMYGKDRLTRPLMRMKDGKFDKNGRFEPVSWEVALDEMARQIRRVYEKKGPAGISIVGSGQYTIPEAYTASKLIKGGFRSNNIDPNARLCMASAVVGFYQTFGVDEPANCYQDIELTNTMILWGNNPAEAHPVLWSRMANRRLTDKNTRIIQLTTHRSSSSNLSDLVIIFRPNTDLAIANFVIREIIKRGRVNKEFVDKHCIFCAGVTDIGYGLRNTDKYAYPAEKDVMARQLSIKLDKWEAIAQGRKEGEVVEQKNSGGTAGKHWKISYEDFCKGVEPYTLDFVAELAKGDNDESLDTFKQKLMQLADYICDPERSIMSYWCMGMNQHQRGVWINELVYDIHLLLGKHALPGNGAFSLTGQPSACGSAREVGAFCHRLPADMLVANPAHRKKTEKLWGIPEGTLNPKVGASLMKILRGVQDESIDFMWTQVVNIIQSAPNNTHWIKACRRPDAFIVVSDIYPTFSARCADLILPVAAHFEKWGLYGNAERRTQGWHQLVTSPGEARTDIWTMFEIAKRFKIGETWKAVPLKGVEGDMLPDMLGKAAEMGIKPEDTLFDVLFAPKGKRAEAVWPDPLYPNELNNTGDALGLPYFPEKALFNEYRQFTLGDGHDLADFDTYQRADTRGFLWPVVNGKETKYRFNLEHDPYAKPDNLFYGKLMKPVATGDLYKVTDPKATAYAGTAKIFFRPYAAPVEQPDGHYDLWLCTGRILEHWHTGSMTRRVPELHRAAPSALLYMNPGDAERRGLKRGDMAHVESRHGVCQAQVETQVRNIMPAGTCWLAFFDEKVRCNAVVIDATDPISEEPDFKKTAVLVRKA